jgi:hypothetical protein
MHKWSRSAQLALKFRLWPLADQVGDQNIVVLIQSLASWVGTVFSGGSIPPSTTTDATGEARFFGHSQPGDSSSTLFANQLHPLATAFRLVIVTKDYDTNSPGSSDPSPAADLLRPPTTLLFQVYIYIIATQHNFQRLRQQPPLSFKIIFI